MIVVSIEFIRDIGDIPNLVEICQDVFECVRACVRACVRERESVCACACACVWWFNAVSPTGHLHGNIRDNI